MHKSVRHRTVIPGVEAISILSDRTFPRHTHDEFGLGYLVDGGQESWSGRGLVEAEAGDIITVNPGELHDGIGRKGAARHWRMLFLTASAVEAFTDLPASELELQKPVVRNPQKLSLVAQTISAVSCDEPDPDRVEELLLLAVRSIAETSQPVLKGQARSMEVTTVLDRIETDFALRLTLSDHAASTGMSRYQILRQFAKEVGTTPHAYLTQHRVKKARGYLRAGLPLAEAAVASGFSDQSHMTRAFVRQLGISPGRYRAADPV
ncbi:AraC family transcriptional regulator [Pelagibius sp.]|uniref:AraC family transcriptional regulator n=1 Tax=Pelagibius sp. TaxID=1931238 RepID=UPI002604E408|nr:AraC family transcriptional regulator [Pelagibius sp.]